MDSKALQKRLLTIYYDARTSLEETGINILYLALGTLKWFEADNAAEERYAPLLLIPVELSRESAEERFKVKWSSEDITSNLSLLEKMASSSASICQLCQTARTSFLQVISEKREIDVPGCRVGKCFPTI